MGKRNVLTSSLSGEEEPLGVRIELEEIEEVSELDPLWYPGWMVVGKESDSQAQGRSENYRGVRGLGTLMIRRDMTIDVKIEMLENIVVLDMKRLRKVMGGVE